MPSMPSWSRKEISFWCDRQWNLFLWNCAFILNAGTSRTILFDGIPADTREPLPFIVRAFNQLGQEVGNVTRNVRIGKPCPITPCYNLYTLSANVICYFLNIRFQFGLLCAVHKHGSGWFVHIRSGFCFDRVGASGASGVHRVSARD